MNLENIDISKLPADVRRKFKQLQVMHAEKKIQNKAKEDFLSFVKCMWPDFIEGSHHRHIADKFNKLASGEITRLIVNMPPRHTKSEFASFLLPAWMVGRDPKLKIIQATHTGELAVRFGRKAKNLIDSEDYGKIFKTRLQEDSKAGWRILCGRCRWSDHGTWCGSTYNRRSTLRAGRTKSLGSRVSLRVVHVRSTTASSAGRQDSIGHDQME